MFSLNSACSSAWACMLGSISRGLISRQAAFASVEGLLCFRFLLILCFGIDSCALVGSLDAFLAIVSQHWLIDHLVRVHWVGHWQFGCYITLQKVCSWDREVTADSKGSMVICTSFWHIHQTPPYSSAQVWQKFRHEIIQYFCVCGGKTSKQMSALERGMDALQLNQTPKALFISVKLNWGVTARVESAFL